MAEEPRNLASDQIRQRYPVFDRLPEMDSDELQRLRSHYTEGFVREDRRRFVTIPTATSDDFVESLRTYWNLGAGAPRFSVAEVLAVRGDHLVLFRSRIDFADGSSTESLVVLSYDEQLRADRATMFEPDDVSTALAEIEERHAADD